MDVCSFLHSFFSFFSGGAVKFWGAAKYPTPPYWALVFLHMFFGAAWFCIKPRNTRFYMFLLFSKRTCQMVFLIQFFVCLLWLSRIVTWKHRTWY
jgi:hypothetical protein